MHWSANVLCWVVALSLQSGSDVVLQPLLRGGDQQPRGERERKTSMQIRRQVTIFARHTPTPQVQRKTYAFRCLRKKSRPYIFVDNFTKAHPNPYFNVARTKGRQSCKERLFFRTLLHSLCEANIEIGGGGWPPQLTHGHARTAFFSQTPVSQGGAPTGFPHRTDAVSQDA